MVLPLIAGGIASILIKEAPSVLGWIFGDKTGKAAEKVTDIARDIFNTDDPQQIEAAIARDPQAALQFKIAVLQAEADVRRGEREEVMSYLHDVQSAREQTIRLAEAKSPISYGAVIVSTIVLITFGTMLYFTVTRTIAPSETSIGMLGVLGTMAVQVVSYWVGSSRGSDSKNATIAQLTGRAMNK